MIERALQRNTRELVLKNDELGVLFVQLVQFLLHHRAAYFVLVASTALGVAGERAACGSEAGVAFMIKCNNFAVDNGVGKFFCLLRDRGSRT